MEFLNATIPFSRGSLLFAPMEGITDSIYREVLFRYFNDWDYYFTDFLRLPTETILKSKKVIEHYGESFLADTQKKKKTCFQILTSPKSNVLENLDVINQYDFKHIDLNLGCPSKRVNAHQGGAYLLDHPELLKSLLCKMRKRISHTFSCKIRTGVHNEKNFPEILQIIEGEGIDYVTIHARTRDQLYKGKANWELIQYATKTLKIPVVGNGDIWTIEDIEKMFKETDCYAIMAARGAMKTPWLAELYKARNKNPQIYNESYLLQERKSQIELYFEKLERAYNAQSWQPDHILRRFKGLSRYMFEDFEENQIIQSQLLRARSFDVFKKALEDFLN